jgi:hypothetical protein
VIYIASYAQRRVEARRDGLARDVNLDVVRMSAGVYHISRGGHGAAEKLGELHGGRHVLTPLEPHADANHYLSLPRIRCSHLAASLAA